ncbi:creatininase family protein [Streptosporangium sp. NPDC002544]|uniref:creatininase family protein n=1 Tax=Streptosporangium sp. NPDC002544 TaxID=3154538 RepID=UPI0033323F5D
MCSRRMATSSPAPCTRTCTPEKTSLLLHACPEVIRPGYHSADWTADDRRHLLTKGMQAYTDSGVIGRPSLAAAEKGKALLDSLASSFGDVLDLFAKS